MGGRLTSPMFGGSSRRESHGLVSGLRREPQNGLVTANIREHSPAAMKLMKLT
jgi:hypothetical protein